MQIQRIMQGKKVICEACGFEYGATKQDLRDIMPVHGDEPPILRGLSFNWITLKELAEKIGVVGRKEFYVLRMKLNELNRSGYIQMDFQVNQVLIRKLRQSKRVN